MITDDDIVDALRDAYYLDTIAEPPEWCGIRGILNAIRAGKVPGVCLSERAEKAEARHAEAVKLLRKCRAASEVQEYTGAHKLAGYRFETALLPDELCDELDDYLAACDGHGGGG